MSRIVFLLTLFAVSSAVAQPHLLYPNDDKREFKPGDKVEWRWEGVPPGDPVRLWYDVTKVIGKYRVTVDEIIVADSARGSSLEWTVPNIPSSRSSAYMLANPVADADTVIRIKMPRGGGLASAYDQTGKYMVIGGGSGRSIIWDLETGFPKTVVDNNASVYSVAFSRDGNMIAVGDGTTKIKVWNAESGKQISTAYLHADRVVSVDFSPDGSKIVSTSYDTTIRIWDTQSGEQIFAYRTPARAFKAMFIDAETIMYSAGNTVRTLHYPSRTHGPAYKDKSPVAYFDLSNDRKKLLVGSADSIFIFDLQSKEETRLRFPDFSGNGRLSPDGTKVAYISGHTGVPVVIDLVTRTSTYAKMDLHQNTIDEFGFSGDGSRLMTTSFEGKAAVWHTDSLRFERYLYTQSKPWLFPSKDGKSLVAVIGSDVFVYSSEGKLLRRFSEPTPIRTFDCHLYKDSLLALGTDSSSVSIWDVKKGVLLKKLEVNPNHKYATYFVRIIDDGRKVVAAVSDTGFVVIDAVTGKRKFRYHHYGRMLPYFQKAVVTPDEQYLLTIMLVGTYNQNHWIDIWNLQNGTHDSVEGEGWAMNDIFLVGDNHFATMWGDSYQEFDIATKKYLRENYCYFKNDVTSWSVDKKARYLAMCANDTHAIIIDLAKTFKNEVMRIVIPPAEGRINTIKWLPGTDTLVYAVQYAGDLESLRFRAFGDTVDCKRIFETEFDTNYTFSANNEYAITYAEGDICFWKTRQYYTVRPEDVSDQYWSIKATPGAAVREPRSISLGPVSVYPNPSRESVTFEWNDETTRQVQVHTMLGQVVLNKIMTSGSTLDISLLPAGSYRAVINGISSSLFTIVK